MSIYRTSQICADCGIEMGTVEIGVNSIEMADFGPYKIWNSDVKECPICHHRILTGFGDGPMREHFEDGFTSLLENTRKNGGVEIKERK